MQTEISLTLPDGRNLAYAEYGHPHGYPVIYFHAAPSSRLEPLMIGDEVFRQSGLRVIAPDRPGMGGSSFQPDREFSDWPQDVAFLADALGLGKFAVLAISGGSGFAAACAAMMPDRLTNVVIASGAWRIDSIAVKSIGSPMNMMWRVTIYAPILLPFILKLMAKMMSRPPKDGFEQALQPPNNIMPAADHAVMAQPGRIAINQQVLREVMRQGSKGPVWDMRLYVREWDFDPAGIHIPVILFHGEQDRNYPLALVKRVADSLPCAQLTSYRDDGHVSTYINHFDDITNALLPE